MAKRLLLISLIFVPLYLFRLAQLPILNIPENKPVKLRGRISNQPYLKGSKQIIKVGPLLIVTEPLPSYFYGQKIELVGKLKREVIGFNFYRYFTYYPSIRWLDEGKNGFGWVAFRSGLLKFRSRLERVADQGLCEPQSSLLNGIFLGAKKQMPSDFFQKLRETGTLHVVVASGQNVTFLAQMLIAGFCLFISRRRALLLAIIAVFGYVLLVGAEPPVVRAGIMAAVAFLAKYSGKEDEATLALVIAAAVMLLISPLILFDIGFQLSFAATAGILWCYDWFQIKPIIKMGLLGNALSTTLAAQLGVTPLILIHFGRVSLLSPIINALVVWSVPMIMIFGAVSAILGLVWLPLGQISTWLAWPLLTYFVLVVEAFADLPGISRQVGQLSGGWVAGYYLVLLIVLYGKKHLRGGRVKRSERLTPRR